jgi:hypothetical protein
MKVLVTLLQIAFVVAPLFAADAQAQFAPAPPPPLQPAETIDLAGPRVGMTFLDTGVRAQLLEERAIDLGPVISQFGWQKEKRFLSSPTGFTGVTEFVFLVGGMDQGVLLPSFNWLVGARTAEGLEFAVGPNVTPAGVALAAAAGVTFRAGNLNIPINVAAVPSRSGLRFSMLFGFNSRNR